MVQEKVIKKALISVYFKDGLEPIVRALDAHGVEIISTGGTRKYIESLGVECTPVEDLTSYPSILGGRVKTLHPRIFGGILGRRDNPDDASDMLHYDIDGIDLVVVDLYPFEATASDPSSSEADIIEKIDIGGITLIRAAAKNFTDVLVIPSRNYYPFLMEVMGRNGAMTSLEERRKMALAGFAVSSGYDSSIFNYFVKHWGEEDNATELRIAEDGKMPLRYGENPHQRGAFYGNFEELFTQLHGKEISYNNLLDIDASCLLIQEFEGDSPTVAILKHNNACGVATRKTVVEAWRDALAGDPVSAFGGIVVSNVAIDAEAASEIGKIFFEVIIAPAYSEEALSILKEKKNRIILVKKGNVNRKETVRSVLDGILVQEKDLKSETVDDLKIVSGSELSERVVDDMLFANKIVKHSKSNAIVLAKHGQLLGSGVGQTSRVDALKQAISKAQSFGFDLHGATMASDAFFPFGDCVEIAHDAGIQNIIQPGGSIRDNESVEFCKSHGMTMVMTGYRHFRH